MLVNTYSLYSPDLDGRIEAALATLAGLSPAAVLCELMNPDGTMMRGEAIERFAEERGFPILTIAELITWRKAGAAG